jgi:hypothetical protein
MLMPGPFHIAPVEIISVAGSTPVYIALWVTVKIAAVMVARYNQTRTGMKNQ